MEKEIFKKIFTKTGILLKPYSLDNDEYILYLTIGDSNLIARKITKEEFDFIKEWNNE